ncbi:MAG: Uma2 family endonuclease [Acidobacteria bacterium]|nr:Uma2 family endonuclease [Acidobacteriota bacterium]
MATPQSKLPPQPPAPRYTPEEYLRLERDADERHEYLDGEIYEMAGESWAHGDVSLNLAADLQQQLKGKPCRARTKDTKILSGPLPYNPRKPKGLFSYPDAVVICGEPELLDDFKDVVTNPTAIFEVLSPSTELRDRNLKFQRYGKWNPTLRDYVLVSQSAPLVEHFQRQADGSWLYRRYEGLEQHVPLASIGCTLLLAELYDRVEFPPDEAELPDVEELDE